MKISLSYIISVFLAVALVALGFSFFEISEERTRLYDELKMRNSLIADEMVKINLTLPDYENPLIYRKVADTLRNYPNVIGAAVFFNNNNIVPINSEVKPFLSHSANQVNLAVYGDSSVYSFFRINKKSIYQYVRPLKKDDTGARALVIYNDPSYIVQILRSILLKNFFRWFVQVLVMLVAVTLLIRWGIFRPINGIVGWIKAVRDGRPDIINEESPVGFLAPLHREVRNIAVAMQEARAVAEEEARLRTTGEAIWTPDRLREEVKRLLPGRTLVVVSNREPYMHIRNGKDIKCVVPASGMVTAMEPILKACGGLWIASASGNADMEVADRNGKIAVPPGEEKYILKRLVISREEEEHFYYGFANEGIWPLCHLAHNRPVFREVDWEYYKKVNRLFAGAVLSEIKDQEQPFILVQDYHFALLPELIKESRPDAIVAIFWHIPWPNPEAFSICPWQPEILKGMLGADLIGFHTQFHCNNFLETVNISVDSRVRWDNFSVRIGDRTTLVKSFPISIAFTLKDYDTRDDIVYTPDELLAPYKVRAEFLGIGVERIDYTKGITEKFLAIEKFLERNPSYIGRFTFVQIGSPSRTLLKSYSDTIALVESEAARINLRFRTRDWVPILLLMRHHSHEEIMPYYKAASLCMVTSLHDGMNLVAKEFVASRGNNDGVLILSRFAGASQELRGAIRVNPYDTIQMADSIKAALEMPRKSQVQRMQRMRQQIVEYNIYLWAASLLRSMVSIEVS